MQLLKIDSPQVQRMINNPAFLSRMRQPVKVIYKYDVPYLAGYSKDAKTIYIDKNLKRYWIYKGKRIDVVQFLLLHEKSEKALIDLFGLDYRQAHHIATWCIEFKAVKLYGIVWDDYDKFLSPQIRLAAKDNLKTIPPDLDLTPYDEEDKKTLGRKMTKIERNDSDRSIYQRRMSKLSDNKATTRL